MQEGSSVSEGDWRATGRPSEAQQCWLRFSEFTSVPTAPADQTFSVAMIDAEEAK
jgi:hypothetical protein